VPSTPKVASRDIASAPTKQRKTKLVPRALPIKAKQRGMGGQAKKQGPPGFQRAAELRKQKDPPKAQARGMGGQMNKVTKGGRKFLKKARKAGKGNGFLDSLFDCIAPGDPPVQGNRDLNFEPDVALPDLTNVPASVVKRNATANISGLTKKFEDNYGRASLDILTWLYERHAMVDPRVAPTEHYAVYREMWNPFKCTRDGQGENEVMQLGLSLCMQDMDVEFVDPHFPPDNTSLFHGTPPSTYGNAEVTNRTDQDGFLAGRTGIEWKRPYEIWPDHEIVVFSGTVDQNDVGQGALGDCYHIAAMSSLGVGDNDNLVQDLIIEDYGHIGLFGVKHFLNGRWVTVVIDDLFACTPDGWGGWNPCFVTPRDHAENVEGEKEIWPMLFEKAFAKLHHSYEALSGGFEYDSSNYLTGGVVDDLWDGDKEAKPNFDWVLNAVGGLNPDASLFTSLHRELDTDECWDMGLVTGHAYSIVKAKRLSTGDELLQVRNPWGSDVEWCGAWSDDDPDWTDELKREVGFRKQGDGAFWMDVDTFSGYFGGIQLCDPTILRTLAGSKYATVDTMACSFVAGRTAGGGPKSDAFECNPTGELVVPKSGTMWFGVYQPDTRCLGEKDSEKDGCVMSYALYVLDPDGGNAREILVTNQYKRVEMVQVEMVAGTYLLRLCTPGGPGITGMAWATVSGQGAKLSEMQQVDASEEQASIMFSRGRDITGGCCKCKKSMGYGSFYDLPKGLCHDTCYE